MQILEVNLFLIAVNAHQVNIVRVQIVVLRQVTVMLVIIVMPDPQFQHNTQLLQVIMLQEELMKRLHVVLVPTISCMQ